MFPCTVSRLRDIISGSGPLDDVDGGEHVTGVAIDSRTVLSGDAFFGIPGSKSHGVLFADEAVECGASCVVTEFSAEEQTGAPVVCFQPADTIETDRRIIRVPDGLKALQQLAMWNREQSSALIVGVTGSVGKTTTRQMIACVLGTQYCGMESPQNFNNELGVPLSLLQLAPEHDFAVLEFGAGRRGDIAQLAGMATPEFGIVTRVAPAHLESFGTLDAIRRTKQELPEAISESGTVFLNADDSAVRSMATATQAKVVLFGFSDDADVRASHCTAVDGICTMTVDGTDFRFQGSRHLATSALAAIATGRVIGISDAEIAEGLATFQPGSGRGRIVQRTPWTVIDDSYNASPASVLAAIEAMADWKSARHRILVLGDMLELGDEATKAHYEIGQALQSSAVDHTLVFGQFCEAVAAGANFRGVPMNRVSVFRDFTVLRTMLDCLLSPGDVVAVKGSRGMQMERIVEWLQEQRGPAVRRSAA